MNYSNHPEISHGFSDIQAEFQEGA